MADANCEVSYTLEDDCCAADLAGPVTEPPEEPPQEPPEEPPEEDSGCPYYCGFGSPEGVQVSTFEEADVKGGMYEQLDYDSTSHPWWAKTTLGGNTGWRPWAGLGSEGVQSYRLGDGSLATGAAALSLGKNSLASGLRSIAIGESALSSGARAEAIGYDTQALADDSKVFGVSAQVKAGAVRGLAIGFGAIVETDAVDAKAIGNTTARHPYEINVGVNNVWTTLTPNPDDDSIECGVIIGRNINLAIARAPVAIGDDIDSTDDDETPSSVFIGRGIVNRGPGNVLIGDASSSASVGAGVDNGSYGVAIGVQSIVNGDCVTAVGHDSMVRSSSSAALGTHTRAGLNNTTFSCTAAGRGAQSLATGGTALGSGALVSSTHNDSIALGRASQTSTLNEFSIGDWNTPITRIMFSYPSFVINNRSGKNLDFIFGQGRGNGLPGTLKFQTGVAGASGNALQTLQTMLEVGPFGVTMAGGISSFTRTVSTSTGLAVNDSTLVVTGAATISLGPLTDYLSGSNGRIFRIKNATVGDTVTLDADGVDLIDGAATYNIPNASTVTLQATAAGWVKL